MSVVAWLRSRVSGRLALEVLSQIPLVLVDSDSFIRHTIDSRRLGPAQVVGQHNLTSNVVAIRLVCVDGVSEWFIVQPQC